MQEELKHKLTQLKASLSDLNELDGESRALLSQLDQDIQSVLSGTHEDDSLSGRIEQQAIEFDSQHPSIAAVLRDMIDVLGKMGI